MTQTKENLYTGLDMIQKVLAGAYKYPISDIHFKLGEPAFYRIFGELKRLNCSPLSSTDLRVIAKTLKPDFDQVYSQNNWSQCDFSVTSQGFGRFRVSMFKQKNTPVIVLRVIPKEIPNFAQLRLPVVVKRIAGFERGLLLVTGATGRGNPLRLPQYSILSTKTGASTS